MKLRKLLERIYYGTKVKIVVGEEQEATIGEYVLNRGEDVPWMYSNLKVESIHVDSDGTLVICVYGNGMIPFPYPYWGSTEYKSTECCQVTHSRGDEKP